MFKKPLADLKTSGVCRWAVAVILYLRPYSLIAPLRSSDRRKLKQRILQAYPVLPSEEGDVLVPDGLQSQKFSTHLEEPGVSAFVTTRPSFDSPLLSLGCLPIFRWRSALVNHRQRVRRLDTYRQGSIFIFFRLSLNINNSVYTLEATRPPSLPLHALRCRA